MVFRLSMVSHRKLALCQYEYEYFLSKVDAEFWHIKFYTYALVVKSQREFHEYLVDPNWESLT
jgi:hypothetical protein